MCEERRDTVFDWLTEGGTKPDLTVPTEDNKHIFDDQPGGTSLEELTKEHLKVVQGRVPLPSSKARRGISHAPVTSSRASSGPRTEIPLLPPRGVDAASQMVLPRREWVVGTPRRTCLPRLRTINVIGPGSGLVRTDQPGAPGTDTYLTACPR
jgi:hypothetical protein